MTDRPISERLALANCVAIDGEEPCPTACEICRRKCAAVTAELATWLDQRFGGSSETAELIRAIYP